MQAIAETSPSHVVRVGEVLAGKYRVEKVLGAGGMGVVVAARHLQLDELVAIKFLLPDIAHSSEAISRFSREARAAAKIKSEHVARVTDVDQLENGTPYMVMEYLEGRDLGHFLSEHGALPIEQAVSLILQACEAIAEAHDRGIVHRDLKPANLFCLLEKDGSIKIKVLDFGISKVTQSASLVCHENMTQSSCVMGSPYYMSPEQLRSSRDVDARTDLWSLGVILYELISGHVPYRANSLPELYLNIVQSAAPSLSGLRPEVPEALSIAVARCLSKSHEKRYASVAEFAADLAPFAHRQAQRSVARILGISERRVLHQNQQFETPQSETGAASSLRETNVDSWGRTLPPAQRRRAWLAVAGIVVFLGASSFLFLSVRRNNVARSHQDLTTVARQPSWSADVMPQHLASSTTSHAAATPATSEPATLPRQPIQGEAEPQMAGRDLASNAELRTPKAKALRSTAAARIRIESPPEDAASAMPKLKSPPVRQSTGVPSNVSVKQRGVYDDMD